MAGDSDFAQTELFVYQRNNFSNVNGVPNNSECPFLLIHLFGKEG
jgi:hypothetical protein